MPHEIPKILSNVKKKKNKITGTNVNRYVTVGYRYFKKQQ